MLILEPKFFGDNRGFFYESFNFNILSLYEDTHFRIMRILQENPGKSKLKMEEFVSLIAEIATLENETDTFVKNEIASLLSSENSAK